MRDTLSRRVALAVREDRLRSHMAKETVDDPARVAPGRRPTERANVDRPGERGHAEAGSSMKYLRIVDVTPGGMRDVWMHPHLIESIEATDNGRTTIRLRSGRALLADQQLDDVLQDLGHEGGSERAPLTRTTVRSLRAEVALPMPKWPRR
ncbi:MAG: hypothetical protein ABI473_07625 [Candidatus Dormibacter sp.]